MSLALSQAVEARRVPYTEAVLRSAPTYYYDLNESPKGTGTAVDLSGNGNDGTYVGSPADAASLHLDGGLAMECSGTNDDDEVRSPDVNASPPYTIEALIQFDDLTAGRRPFSAAAGGAVGSVGIGNSTANRLDMWDNLMWDVLSIADLATGTIYHMTFHYTSTTNCDHYQNGVQQNSAAFQADPDVGTQIVKFGGRFGAFGSNLNGQLDDIAFYTRALTSGEAIAHYKASVGDLSPGDYGQAWR